MLTLSAGLKIQSMPRRPRRSPPIRAAAPQHPGKLVLKDEDPAHPLPALHHAITAKILEEPLLWSAKRRFHAGQTRPSYTFSNERFPWRLQHVARAMDPGMWVGVGQEYMCFRMQASADAWAALAQRANVGADATLLQNPATRQFWNIQMGHPSMQDFHATPKDAQSPFYGAHYLSQDALYERLVKLAREGRVQTAQVNLSQSAHLQRITQALRTASHVPPMSVLDISKAWAPAYLNPAQLFGVVKAWQGVATDACLLVGTHAAWVNDTANYTYFAAHFSALSAMQGKCAFMDWLASVRTQSQDGQGLAGAGAIERIDPHVARAQPDVALTRPD